MMKIKKAFFFGIPVSICNLRCHYCYLSQRDVSFQGIHPEMKYSPEQFGEALNYTRVGGYAYGNFCADGETFLVKGIDEYVKAFVQEGHYADVITNLTITNVLDKFLLWDKELLKRVEFKCSFHYLELKKRGLLDTFASNVRRIWDAGGSATVEITPSDELIPYIEEVMDFSMKNFGALPHLTIARNDRTEGIEYLTNLSDEEYMRVWSRFKSNLWEFKRTIFGKKQTGFCYAGAWSLQINLCTGEAYPCYFGSSLGDVFSDPKQPFPEKPVGKCQIAHCYNGHALLTMGLIPNITDVRYADVRNRTCEDGKQWLQPELCEFFSSNLVETNTPYTKFQQRQYLLSTSYGKSINYKSVKYTIKTFPKRIVFCLVGEKNFALLKERFKRK